MTRTRLPLLLLLLPFAILHLAALPAFAASAWFVDNSGSGGDGSVTTPFASLAEAEKASAAGDVIVVLGGAEPYAGGIALKEQQSLVGQAGDVRAAFTRAGIASEAPAASDRVPVLLAGDSYAISIAGSAHVDGIAITGAGTGVAIRIEEGRGEIEFVRVRIDRSAGAAVAMRRHEGNVTFGAGTTIRVAGGRTDAVSLLDSRSTVTFAEPLDLATIGARALVAEKMTKLVIGAGSALQTTDAAVLELRDVELDATFAALSASGVDTGVTLARTRGSFVAGGGTIRGARRRGLDIRDATNITLRGFVVTATGSGVDDEVCAADLLVHDNARCSAALLFQNVENLVVEDVRVDGSGQLGVSGRDLRNAAFRRVTIDEAGDELSEHAFVFRDLLGEVSFTNCVVQRSASRGLYVVNERGAGTIAIEDCRFSESAAPHGQQGVLIAAEQTAKLQVSVRKSSFSKLASAAIHISADGSATVDATVSENTFEQTGGAVSLVADEKASVTFDVAGNRVSGATVNPINVALSVTATTATMSGVIARNTVDVAQNCASCSGIAVRSGGTGTMKVNVHRNDVAHVSGSGIQGQALGRSRLDIAVAANALHDPVGTEASAIRLQAGGVAADIAVVCARIGGTGALANKVVGGWDPRGVIQLVNRTASTLRLSGPASGADEAATAWIRQHNGGASVRIVRAPAPRADAITSGYECSVPTVR